MILQFRYGCGGKLNRGIKVPTRIVVEHKSTSEKRGIEIATADAQLYKFRHAMPSANPSYSIENDEMKLLYWKSKEAFPEQSIIYQSIPKYRGSHLPVPDPSLVQFQDPTPQATVEPPRWLYGYGIHLEVGTRFPKVIWACGIILALTVGTMVGVSIGSRDVSKGISSGVFVFIGMPILVVFSHVLGNKRCRWLE